jgi:predicted DNA-binding transcriptional regulator AlpA
VTTLGNGAVTDPDEILDTDQVAALLQIRASTLKRWRLVKKGPRYFRAGRHVRYRLSSVLAWVEEAEDAAAAIAEVTPIAAQPPARPGTAEPQGGETGTDT